MDAESGLRDRVEVYNIPSEWYHSVRKPGVDNTYFSEFNGDFKHEHPEWIEQNLPEIEEFARVSNTDF